MTQNIKYFWQAENKYFHIANIRTFINNSKDMKPTLGILGGGQLGMMMMPAINKLEITAHILDPNPECSCANLTDNLTVGSFADYDTVLKFGQSVDIITVEIEHVNVDALEELEKQGKVVRPSSHVLRTIQDKLKQKQFFKKHNIPTSAFIEIQNKTELEKSADFLPAAQKTRTGGYDGQGVKLLKNSTDISNGFDAPSVLEKLVDIDQELSVIVARRPNGDIKTFPTVGQDFDPEANLVKFVYAPAEISAEIDQQCQDIAKKIAEKFQLEGILAIEFFLDKTGNILVNEVAPRAHNSGHWSIEGAQTSQFEQLVRAAYDLPLGNTDLIRPSVMVNLLGAPNHTGNAIIKKSADFPSSPDVHLHWYEKKLTKPMRKMGHLTVLADTLESAKQLGQKVLDSITVEAE